MNETLCEAEAIIEAVWQEMLASPYIRRERGEQCHAFADLSLDAVAARAERARHLLIRIEAIDVATLPADVGVTLEVARSRAVVWQREPDWYWLVFDPMGVGFYALFGPTAYAGGFLLNDVHQTFAEFKFDAPADEARYLALVSDYGRLVRQLCERTLGQAERGIIMPRAQLAPAVELLRGFRERSRSGLNVSTERLAESGLAADSFAQCIERRVAETVLAEYDAFIALLDAPDYAARAPDSVGMGQYPGGSAIYEELVRLHTTLDLTPGEVHQRGIERMERVRGDMAALFDEVSFTGTPADYLAKLAEDPCWRATDATALQAMFRRYMDRLRPHLADWFDFAPSADYDAAPLPESLEGSMTFGFYSAPNAGQSQGLYLFNARNLSVAPLPNIAALNYHELVPGHHFHEASQLENAELHPVRKHNFVNAFNEGWAEYAATLAGEIGMYQEPEERFGRYMMDAFLTCRLVVDTGMNVLGWSLEEARDYMRANAFMPETEICSETVRYSCGIPAQSLAYKLGDEFLLEQREVMRSALGDRFDVRRFHDAVLRPGALPLPVLARHLAAETQRLAAA